MKILKSPQAKEDARFPAVCARVKYFKEGKGRNDMCSVVEEYAAEIAKEAAEKAAKEAAEKTAKELIASGIEDAIIQRATKLSFGEIQSIRESAGKN